MYPLTLHTNTLIYHTHCTLTQTTHTGTTHTAHTHLNTHSDTHTTPTAHANTHVHYTYCTRSHMLTHTLHTPGSHTHTVVWCWACSVSGHTRSSSTGASGSRAPPTAPPVPAFRRLSPPVSAAPSLLLFEWTCVYVSTCPGQSHLKQCQRHLHSVT